ncbi:hypothetical protein M440DRAFT_1401202 [Trichoderma longibrachiatum ATCC 18648]|uniref:Uncharacterized protein n=1 Tax=Trichoderma longibrachiatum ATCC 18648 TaxID=983965 RepID=A0A2T4C5Q4_TRILO|nr:hypothetical protein M440DRAFT_1401202 [Trichoderma longibrachiatum ATCC 18648]
MKCTTKQAKHSAEQPKTTCTITQTDSLDKRLVFMLCSKVICIIIIISLLNARNQAKPKRRKTRAKSNQNSKTK